MKLLTRSICALFFMGISLMLNASVEPTVSTKVQKGQSFSIHLKDLNNQTFNIQLFDENNLVLLNEKVIGQDDYLKLFNLKNLPIGHYKLKIEDDRKVIVQDINIFEERLAIDQATEFIKPSILQHSSYLDLNMISYKDKTIDIKIRDENSEVLYEEQIDEVGPIDKRFNIAALHAGSYTVEVITSHYTYQQEFTVVLNQSRNLKTSNKSQRKSSAKNQVTTEAKEDQYPYIMNRIKWLQSKKN